MNIHINDLMYEIHRFKKWAYQNNVINGEWETFYNDWNSIYTKFLYVIENVDISEINCDKYLNDMIYIIARDNECEYIIDCLTDYSKYFETLLKYCIDTDEYDCKWQFAHYLGDYVEKNDCSIEIKNIIIKFLYDKNEYVRRRALIVLYKILPDKVEHFANIFWNNAKDQYERMAVIDCLYNSKSNDLKKYIENAYKLDSKNNKYLIEYCNKIQNLNTL